jgi:hypothetical protein
MLGGLAATAAILLGSSPLGTSLWGGWRGVMAAGTVLPSTTTGTLMLLGGLLVYAFGLFRSLEQTKHRS